MMNYHQRRWSPTRDRSAAARHMVLPRGKCSRITGAALSIAVLLLVAPAALAVAGVDDVDAMDEAVARQWALAAAFGVQGPVFPPAVHWSVERQGKVHYQAALTTDDNYQDSTVSGNHLVMLGSRSTLSGSQSVAYGNLIRSHGDNNTAMGHGVQVVGGYATGVGAGARADGIGTTALGHRAAANSFNSIAIGSGSVTGRGTGDSKIAIGGNAYAGSGGSTGAVALGGESRAEYDSIAVGYAAKARHSNAVALGSNSETNGNNQVSVGSSRLKRKLVNVADAELSSASSDAVTGRQLAATNTQVKDAQESAARAQSAAGNALARTAVLGGLVSQESATGTLRLGAENAGTAIDVANKSGAQRRIHNIANGTVSAASTDAVTGRQLHATNTTVDVQGRQVEAHRKALADHSGQIAGNRRDLDALRSDVDGLDLDGVVRYAADGVVDLGGAVLRGVGAGDISSASSTEAVNGGQLFATNSRIAKVERNADFLAVGLDDQSIAARAGKFSVALGDEAVAGGALPAGPQPRPTEGATAIGAFAKALGQDSVALGRSAFVDKEADKGFALGMGANVYGKDSMALGAHSEVQAGAVSSVALGSQSVVSSNEFDVVSVGNSNYRRRIVNVARGTADHDAIIAGQLREALSALGGGAGLDAQGNVQAPRYEMQGGLQRTVGDALSVLDSAVVMGATRVGRVEDQLRAVFQDSPVLRSDGLSKLSLAGADGMLLSNVANGVISAGSRDAVNGGQLHSLQQQLNGRVDGLEQQIGITDKARSLGGADGGDASVTPSMPEAAAEPPVAGSGSSPTAATQSPTPSAAQVDTAELEKMLARANEYTDGAIGNVERRLEKMDKRFNRMAAMSSAQSAMAMNTAGLATYNRLGAGVGHSDGESALAVGYQRVLNQRGSATFSLQGSFTNSGERGMGVGVGVGW